MSDKMTTERVDLRKSGTTDTIREEELIARRNAFVNNGFSVEWISALELQRPTLYSPSVVSDHLSGLTERGFSNPNKMIESLPAILGYAFENIDRRLNLIGRLISLYDLPFFAPTLMEQDSALFSSKIDKMIVLVGILKEYRVNRVENTDSLLRSLLHSNLEDTLVALKNRTSPNEHISDLMRRIKSVNRQKLSREDKRKIIKEELEGFEKIKKRYFRGYPGK